MSSSESPLSSSDDVSSSEDSDTSLSDEDSMSEEDDLLSLRSLKIKLCQEDRKLTAALREAQASGDNYDEERLNIEKTILSTTLATKQMLYNYKKMKELNHSNVCRIGSVTLSNIKVNYIYDPNSNNIKHYFLCALTISEDCSLFLSEICEAGPDGVINFNVNHTYSDLSKDFEIFVDIYALEIEKQSLSKRLKQRIEKLFNPKENVDDDTFHRPSLFEFWKGTIITIDNVNRTKEIGVEIVDMKFRKLLVDTAGVIDTSSFSYRSWMSVWCHGRFWESKWCVLKGTQLECFDGVDEDQDTASPVISLDLKSCVEVTICTENQQANNRLLKLTMKNGDLEHDFCMCTSSRYHFTQWEKLKSYIATLKEWREANCLVE